MWNCSSWTEISLTSLLCFFHALVLPVPLSGTITQQQHFWLPLLLPPSSPCLSSNHPSINHALFFGYLFTAVIMFTFEEGSLTMAGSQAKSSNAVFFLNKRLLPLENGAKWEMRVGLNLEDLEEKYWSSFCNPNNPCFGANINIQVKIMTYECTDMRIWDNIDIRYNNIAVLTDCTYQYYSLSVRKMTMPLIFLLCFSETILHELFHWKHHMATHSMMILMIPLVDISSTYRTNKDILKTLLTLAVLMLIQIPPIMYP